MKKQFLLAAALLFTATAYSQINPEHGTKVRTIARTETESNGTAVSTVAADGSQSPAKARGGKTDRINGMEGCRTSGKTRGAGMGGGVHTSVRTNSGTGSKLNHPSIRINNRINIGARNL